MDVSQGRSHGSSGLLGFIALLSTLLLAWIAEETAAAEQHQVGGPPGWSLPSLANVNYTVWASTQTLKVGDTLYFNYSSAYQNVLEVTQANYESCEASSPKKTWTDGADVIALNSAGTFYFICGIAGHCDQGQKVAVEVTTTSSGARHQVGGAPGWSLPSRANVNYTVWASTETFLVGDSLYFNYSRENHNVLEVTKSSYDACNASDPISEWDDGATVVPLNKTGMFYYICGVAGHCEAGQKFAATVRAEGTPSPPMAPAPGGATGPGAPPPGSSSSCPSHPFSSVLPSALLALSLAYHLGCNAASLLP